MRVFFFWSVWHNNLPISNLAVCWNLGFVDEENSTCAGGHLYLCTRWPSSLAKDLVHRWWQLSSLMRSWYSSDFTVISSVIVPMKPSGVGGGWLYSWCIVDKMKLARLDSWWSGYVTWTFLIGLIMLLPWLQRFYHCTGSKMSSGGSIGEVVTETSSSSRRMRCGVVGAAWFIAVVVALFILFLFKWVELWECRSGAARAYQLQWVHWVVLMVVHGLWQFRGAWWPWVFDWCWKLGVGWWHGGQMWPYPIFKWLQCLQQGLHSTNCGQV